jgi:hypothetical protein
MENSKSESDKFGTFQKELDTLTCYSISMAVCTAIEGLSESAFFEQALGLIGYFLGNLQEEKASIVLCRLLEGFQDSKPLHYKQYVSQTLNEKQKTSVEPVKPKTKDGKKTGKSYSRKGIINETKT